VRPNALAAQYARIANALAATWHTPRECRSYLNELLTDTRGTRKGFPPDVKRDLQRLRDFYGTL
jgi:hypothetical protein